MLSYGIPIFASLLINVVAGLQCFTCDNAQGMIECAFKGTIKQCQNNQKTCETVVRRSGKRLTVIKSCKQKQACLETAKSQISYRDFGDLECNRDHENSACTCCCEDDLCNLNTRPCIGMTFPCEPRVTMENGNLSCTNGAMVDSVCTYKCNKEGFFLRPVIGNGESICLASGTWSQPKPCCARACPPNLYNDIVFMRQTNNQAGWNEFQRMVETFIGQLNVESDGVNVGVVSYGDNVHANETIKLSQFSSDKDDLLLAVNNLPFVPDDGPDVRTGNALTYVLEEFYSPGNGDRRDSKNVIILQADKPTADDVNRPAYLLRQAGFTIYTILPHGVTNDDFINQAHVITGKSDQVFTLQAPNDITFLEDLMRILCSNPCTP